MDAFIEEFVQNYVVHLPGAFSRDLVEAWVQDSFRELGIDEADPSTWSIDGVFPDVTCKAFFGVGARCMACRL